MDVLQIIVSLGLGGGLAYLMIKWLTKEHIPALIAAFKEEMALERQMHLEAIRAQGVAVERLADEIRRLAVEGRSGRGR